MLPLQQQLVKQSSDESNMGHVADSYGFEPDIRLLFSCHVCSPGDFVRFMYHFADKRRCRRQFGRGIAKSFIRSLYTRIEGEVRHEVP
jgi:hypothetical protein